MKMMQNKKLRKMKIRSKKNKITGKIHEIINYKK